VLLKLKEAVACAVIATLGSLFRSFSKRADSAALQLVEVRQ